MWTRSDIKFKARLVLGKTYWKAFAASLVLSFAAGSSSIGASFGDFDLEDAGNGVHLGDPGVILMIGGIIFAVMAVAVSVGLVYSVFVLSPLEVGGQKFFVRNQQEDGNLAYLGAGFKGGTYIKVVLTMLFKKLFIFLWSLLFIVPGIIKGYAYKMVPYILAENPGLEWRKALALSERMTKGHKWDMFVLDLSFIGWLMLGTMACFVGVIFVQPYIHATWAELYLRLKELALKEGLAESSEFAD